MKKFFLSLALLGSIAASVLAMTRVYNGALVNETGLAYNKTYPLIMSNNGTAIDYLAFQAVYSSATFANEQFFNTSISSGSPIISIPNNSFTLGLGVVYSTAAVGTLPPLVSGTTYYVIPLTANTIELATTSLLAQAGTPVVISSGAVNFSTFTLTAQAITGTPSFKFQVSEDGLTWNDYTSSQYGVIVGSITMTTYVFPSTSTVWDFGPMDHAQIRINAVAPTTGAIKLTVTGNGKNTNPTY